MPLSGSSLLVRSACQWAIKVMRATCDGLDGPAVRVTCAVQLCFGELEVEVWFTAVADNTVTMTVRAAAAGPGGSLSAWAITVTKAT